MAKNHTFRFRVTTAQFDQIREEAKSQGYLAMSAYIRDLALNRNRFIEGKIIETNVLIKKMLEAGKNGK